MCGWRMLFGQRLIALKRWTVIDSRWKIKALSRWSPDSCEMRLPSSLKNWNPTLFIGPRVSIAMRLWSILQNCAVNWVNAMLQSPLSYLYQFVIDASENDNKPLLLLLLFFLLLLLLLVLLLLLLLLMFLFLFLLFFLLLYSLLLLLLLFLHKWPIC